MSGLATFDGEVVFEADCVSATRAVSGSEPFVLGHYPGDPIFPGVLSLELMLAACERLVETRHGTPAAVRVKRVQFLEIVRPGDGLRVVASVKRASERQVELAARIAVGDAVKSRATVVCDLS